jgi:hypothetical protein
MTYELAKQLHESGFPNLAVYAHSFNYEQNNNPHKPGWDVKVTCKFCGEIREFASSSTLSTIYFDGCPVITNYIFPTLSELIEACGDEFYELVRDEDGTFICRSDYTEMDIVRCSTPEEAVANLYLKLNNKQPTKMSD